LKHDTSNPDAGNIQRAIDMANGTSLAGTWGYRSYLNTADQRLFGAGIFTFQTPTGTTLAGTFDMGNQIRSASARSENRSPASPTVARAPQAATPPRRQVPR
jgi:hypothetical protein